MEIREYGYIRLIYSEQESEAVRLAVLNLRRDLMRTLQCRVNVPAKVPMQRIIVGTAGCFSELEEKADLFRLKDRDGKYRREAFLIQEKDGELLIVGTDRRGTVYGIYDFCQWLGVSPWYFFADVPVRRRRAAEIPQGYCKVDYPSVEYRGIFINDEEELEHWVWRYMGEETIGVKTYEKIFELLLRLKLNYIWPAMHVNSFNVNRENGALADRMGIVVGTSHCDMLMRSNNREWRPWLKKKGYTGVEYDFSLPGRNREILKEYWRESVEQNRDFEVSYTLGMRGIHDSGFETRSLEGLEGEELLKGKIDLLEAVIKAQQEILDASLDKTPMKIFVPYKEVLELYDHGLTVPEDLTLIWTNDNHGYVRRYPGEKEKRRRAGNGIYYHNSYWAPPGASYLFICSIPLAHTRNELIKAYEEGIRKVWVTNFGAVKPLEQQLSFYARLAWEADRLCAEKQEEDGRVGAELLTADEEQFLQHWLDGMFSGEVGRKLAPLLLEFDQVTNARKLEHMDSDCFSQTAWGDEAAGRIHVYERLCREMGEIYDKLPGEEKDAFFQLVLMKVQAAYFTNAMYYYADRSNLCISQGKNAAASRYTLRCKEFDDARRKLLYYYNHVMSNGKWDGILTPEDYPPPRTAMYPACKPPLCEGERTLIVTCWNNQEQLEFTDRRVKWIELANGGAGTLSYRITGPDWLWIEDNEGEAEEEKRICLGVLLSGVSEAEFEEKRGELTIYSGEKVIRSIPVCCRVTDRAEIAVEDSGRVVVEAADSDVVKAIPEGWRAVSHLGRGRGSLMEGRTPGARLTQSFFLTSSGRFLLELHRFPSLNSVGRLRIGVSVDNSEMLILESASNDEHRGNWKQNVLNNVDKLYCRLPYLEAGEHTLTYTVIDRYISFSRAVIYTREYVENSLGYEPEDQRLPLWTDLEVFTRHYYGQIDLEPRPVLYLPEETKGDSLTMEDIMVVPQAPEPKITSSRLLLEGQKLAEERQGSIDIHAASALAQGEGAWMGEGKRLIADIQNDKKMPSMSDQKGITAGMVSWNYCSSPSHQGTGLAVYIRREGLHWDNIEEAPSLHYRFRAEGGSYTIWLQTYQWGTDSCRFTLGLDGRVARESELYEGNPVWRYSSEHVWKWIPAWRVQMEPGVHELTLYSLCSGMRFDKISIRHEGLPQ